MEDNSLFIFAGDPSGDNAAARLLQSLKDKSDTKFQLYGLGGSNLKTAGQHQLASMDEIAVIGFWEVAKKYLFFRKLFYRCLDEIKSKKPKAVIFIDYPGFNLRLAKEVKKLGIPVIYYISPQVWAWGKGRLKKMKDLVDLMLLILPFEEEIFRAAGVNAHYVGNYLTEDIPPEYLASEIPENGHLALLPGSRKQEIEKMLPVMIETAHLFYNKYKIKSVVAGLKDRFDYESYLKNIPDSVIEISYNNPRKIVNNAKLVVSASGTATLETALISRPMVIIYKTGTITYQIAKRLIKLDKIGLANLVPDEMVVPELIQGEATAANIMAALEKYINNSDYLNLTKEKLNRTVKLLGVGSASDKAAGLILDYLK